MGKSKRIAVYQRKGFMSLFLVVMVAVVSVFSSCEGLVSVQGVELYAYNVVNLDGSKGMEYLLRQSDLVGNGIPAGKFSRFDVKTKGNSEQNALQKGDDSVISEFNEYAAKVDKSKLKYKPYKLQIIRDEKVQKDEITYETKPKVIYEYVFQ